MNCLRMNFFLLLFEFLDNIVENVVELFYKFRFGSLDELFFNEFFKYF